MRKFAIYVFTFIHLINTFLGLVHGDERRKTNEFFDFQGKFFLVYIKEEMWNKCVFWLRSVEHQQYIYFHQLGLNQMKWMTHENV